jgi:hypothetical protein
VFVAWQVSSDLGWVAFLRGELDAAQAQLEQAVAAAGGAGGDGVTAAEAQYRLGRVLWARGGDAREQRDGALAHLLQAAAASGRCQARACFTAARVRFFAARAPE